MLNFPVLWFDYSSFFFFFFATKLLNLSKQSMVRMLLNQEHR